MIYRKSILLTFLFAFCCYFAQSQTMVVNEIMFKPGPSTVGCDQKMASQPQPTCGREYVELYNSDCTHDFDLSGFVLASANINDPTVGNGGAICFPPGTIVPAGSFLIVGGANDHNTVNGTFDYLAGSFDFKIPNYIGTQYLCLNTANTYWFLSNYDGWMALYEPSGIVHSAVYWSAAAGDISTTSDFTVNPCSPTAYTGVQLKSALQIFQTTPALIQYMGDPAGCNTGNTFSRLPDGGTFQTNRPPTIGPLRTQRCNDGSCIACGNLILSSTPDTCGAHNGSISALILNQTASPPPYSFQVTGPVNIGPVSTSTDPYTFSNLPAGTYIVSVTDNFVPPNHTVDTIIVGSTGSLTITGITSTPASCNASNGSATVNATGGSGISYTWSSIPVQSTQTAANLPAGNYTVTVSSSGCSATSSVTVSSLNGPTVSIAGTTQAGCGMSNGGATTSANGGSLPYTYNWNSIPVQTTANLQNVPAGSYSVTITDSGNCSATATVVITSLTGPSASINATVPANCGLSNGSATASVQGGSLPYTYAWSTTPVQNSQTASGLPAGSYSVTISDAGSCTATATTVITSLPGPSASISTTVPANCGLSNGSATVSGQGGSLPYTYAWSTTPVQNSQTASGLPAGSYSVTISDAGSCTATATTVITSLPGPSASISTTVPANCGLSNGSATVSGQGGSLPYTYTWNSTPVQNTQTAANLPAGSYSVTVTDAGNCTATASAVITSLPGPSASISTTVPAICGLSDGSISVSVHGGSLPYTYAWNTTPVQNTQTAANLPTGSYSVTVTDAGNCTSIASGTIAVNNNLQLTFAVIDAHCGQADGQASVAVAGGSGSYSYVWNTNPPANTAAIVAVSPGSYSVTVDGGGCSSSASCVIGNISGPEAVIYVSPHIVSDIYTDGTVTFNDLSVGNIVNLQWNLGDGNTSTQQNFLYNYASPGSYIITLTVTDPFGCSDTATDSVKVYDLFTVYIPNAFSPVSSDGKNDFFFPKGNFPKEDFRFYIYDRWGGLFFQTDDPDIHWNGTKFNSGSDNNIATGIYVYYITLKDWMGLTHQYKGIVSVM